MRINELLKASLTSYILLVAKFLPLLVVVPIILRNYDEKESALWLSFGSFFVVQNLIISGFGGALVRAILISKKLSENSTISVIKVAFNTYKIVVFSTTIISLLYSYSIIDAIYGGILNLKYAILLIHVLLFSISNGFGNYNQSVLFAYGRLPHTRIIDAIIYLFLCVADFYLVVHGLEIYLILSFHFFTLSLRYPILFLYRRRHVKISRNFGVINHIEGRKIFLDSAVKSASSSIMASFTLQIFNLILLWHYPISEVNVVLYCFSLVTQIDSVSRIPFYSSTPVLTRRYLDRSGDLNKGIYTVTLQVLILSFFGFAFIYIDWIRDMLPFIVKEKFELKIFTLLFISEGFGRLAGMKLQIQSFSNRVKFHIGAFIKLISYLILLLVYIVVQIDLIILLRSVLFVSLLLSIIASYYLRQEFRKSINFLYYLLDFVILCLILL